MNSIYRGLFFNEPSKKKLQGRPGELERIVSTPHITFDLGIRDCYPVELMGTLHQIRVIGEGNDGKNHGLLVEIPEELLLYYQGAPQPHITLSLAEGAQAVNTGKLNFIPLELPFYVEGVMGCYTKSGVQFEVWKTC